MGSHDEFLALCAISTSGQITEEEQNRLKLHLAICPACRDALREYEAVLSDAIPAIGAEKLSHIDPGPGWSQSKAEKAFFDRIAKDEDQQTGVGMTRSGVPSVFRRVLPVHPESSWHHAWTLYAAGILLFITLCLSTYWVGVQRGTNVATSARSGAPTQTNPEAESAAFLEEQLSDAAHDREIARSQVVERDKAIVELRRQLQQQSAEITRMKEVGNRLQAALQRDRTGKQDFAQQQTELSEKLEAAQQESRTLQEQVDSLTQQSTADSVQANALSAKVEDLTRLLQEREAALNREDELLAHDRDIREVIGARNLYIAEVYDTDEKGATRKPYGRLFYTKEKSLIFYAYDLDQQDTKHGQTFQAWGRRGPDWKQAVSLGIFYEDSASKKRWVLKAEDPKTLAQIDAVFVTLEPHGGSNQPSGRPLLFAYLNRAPNHP